MGGAHGVVAGGACELVDGAVFDDEDGGPDEVGEEASPEYDDEGGEILPEVETVFGEELGLGDVTDGLACRETEGEEAAHDACEDGNGEAFAEGKVGLSGLGFFFGGHFALLGDAGGTIDGYGDEADEDAKENDLAGGLVHDGVNGAVVDGWNERSEDHTEAESDRVSEGKAEIANGEAEGESAEAPECSEENGEGDGVVIRVGMGLA